VAKRTPLEWESIVKIEVEGTLEEDGKADSRWEGGCFSRSNSRDLSYTSQKGSEEQAIQTAPLKSPSSSFSDTLVASEL
jgi:hypothetical protein